jgi:hypothetical protein
LYLIRFQFVVSRSIPQGHRSPAGLATRLRFTPTAAISF